MRIDLHMHSTASDGALPPADVVSRARAGGLDLVALADHDTVAGIEEARSAARDGPRLVPAIEISANHGDDELHILGYGIDPADPAMTSYDRRARTVREQRILEMIERLAELDVDVGFDAVVAEAGPDVSALARPHLARALHTGGHVRSIAEAFDRYIGNQAPAFVPVRLLDATDAVRLIHDAGGVAVWAHPSLEVLDDVLDDLVQAGLDGLECHRPRVAPPELKRFLKRARDRQLLVTGGSDWHGEWHGTLGEFHVGRDQIGPFLDRLGL